MAMQKKAKAPEPAGESAPMWIVSFADLVTLMMSFFVVLYALKQGGEKQQIQVAAAIRTAFDPNFVPPADSNSDFDQQIRRNHGMMGPPYSNSGGRSLKPTEGAEGRDEQVTTIRPGHQIVEGSKITFDVNKTALDAASMETIRQIAAKLQGHNNICYVKGHVSGDELALRPDDPEGMTLSHMRAQAVIEELVKLNIDKKVLRLVECGPYEPVKVGAYDAATLRQNRRVEVFSTENTASEFHPTNTVPATEQANAVK